MSEFDDDLDKSQPSVDKVLLLAQRKNPYAFKTIGMDAKGDIAIPKNLDFIEVKYDLVSNETQNYLIEVTYNDKPSGLNSTQSDFWAIDDGKKILKIRCRDIWRCISDHQLRWVRQRNGKDLYYKNVYLIPKDTLCKYGMIISNE